MFITIPVIVLSTLTGTANFAIDSFIPAGDADTKRYVQAGIGGISIFAGILTTLGNFFRFAQKSEAHKVAGVSWGKFQRQIAVELALNPLDRIDAMDFLKICRQDLDRLIEQSPPIPDKVIEEFETEFKHVPNLAMPDICHGIRHTRVYDSSKSRLSKITADAALHLKYKKGVLKDTILPDIDRRIQQELDTKIEQRIKELLPIPETSGVELTKVVAGLENDWRTLLAGRKHIQTPLSAVAAGASPGTGLAVPTPAPLHAVVVLPEEVSAAAALAASAVPPTPLPIAPPNPEVSFN
jgi:hypothetical protein